MDTASPRSILVLAHDDHVIGIDRRSGAHAWRCDLTGTSGRVLDLAIDRDLVFVASENGTLFCIDYATGVGRWSVPFEHAAFGAVPPTILIDEGQVLVAFFGRVTAFTREGQRLWAFRDASESNPSAVGVPGNVRAAHRLTR